MKPTKKNIPFYKVMFGINIHSVFCAGEIARMLTPHPHPHPFLSFRLLLSPSNLWGKMTSRQEAVCLLVLPSIKVPLGFQNKHAPLAFEKFPRPPSHTTSQLFGRFVWKSNIPLTCTASRLLISHWERMRWFPRCCCGRQVFSFSPKWWLPWFQCFRRAWLEVIEEMLLGYYLIPCL